MAEPEALPDNDSDCRMPTDVRRGPGSESSLRRGSVGSGQHFTFVEAFFTDQK